MIWPRLLKWQGYFRYACKQFLLPLRKRQIHLIKLSRQNPVSTWACRWAHHIVLLFCTLYQYLHFLQWNLYRVRCVTRTSGDRCRPQRGGNLGSIRESMFQNASAETLTSRSHHINFMIQESSKWRARESRQRTLIVTDCQGRFQIEKHIRWWPREKTKNHTRAKQRQTFKDDNPRGIGKRRYSIACYGGCLTISTCSARC